MLSAADRDTLLRLARESVRHGLDHGIALTVNPDDYSDALRTPGASFVTLQRRQRLRGCIGMLQPVRPLVEDVVENAFAAAFHDSRFKPLDGNEFADLDIHISILGEPEPLPCDSEADLLRQLRPGIDGLILQYGARRATFLPSVWEQLQDKREFLAHLKQKAGLAAGFWSNELRVERYEVAAL
jgi:AmmeMemoRadiSam system protein A